MTLLDCCHLGTVLGVGALCVICIIVVVNIRVVREFDQKTEQKGSEN